MRVRWEGEQLPRVMTAPPGSAAAVAARAAAASPTSILSKEARARLPGTAWRREFVASFAEHRQYVARWAARCAADPSVMPVQRATPDPSDEAAWRAYCFGSATAKGHAPLISVLVGMEERTAAAARAARQGPKRAGRCSRHVCLGVPRWQIAALAIGPARRRAEVRGRRRLRPRRALPKGRSPSRGAWRGGAQGGVRLRSWRRPRSVKCARPGNASWRRSRRSSGTAGGSPSS